MHAERQLELGVAHADLAQQWQRVAAVLLCVAVPLLVFAPTVVDMAAIWWRSDTFTHGFLVFPAFVYLVWSQRAELAASPVLPAPRALFAVFGCGFLWASGVLAGALPPSFFGLTGLSVSSVITVLGWRVAVDLVSTDISLLCGAIWRGVRPDARRVEPDFLWDKPHLERLYARLEDEYELKEREESLNRKLAVVAETAQVLTDIIDTSRSLRLELIIVFLILFEVLITIYQLAIARH